MSINEYDIAIEKLLSALRELSDECDNLERSNSPSAFVRLNSSRLRGGVGLFPLSMSKTDSLKSQIDMIIECVKEYAEDVASREYVKISEDEAVKLVNAEMFRVEIDTQDPRRRFLHWLDGEIKPIESLNDPEAAETADTTFGPHMMDEDSEDVYVDSSMVAAARNRLQCYLNARGSR
jgi:hypothetical protein